MTTHVSMTIDGMHCPHCVHAVRKELALLSVQVGAVVIGSAEIDFTPGAVTRERVEEAVRTAGYAVRTWTEEARA